LLAGEQDQLWPSPAYAATITSTLNDHHDPYPHTEITFPAAGHEAGAAFPYDAASQDGLGGTPVADSAAETQAWNDILSFLAKLTTVPPARL
jgi:hypothetical protein